jgi:hypothetical protein
MLEKITASLTLDSSTPAGVFVGAGDFEGFGHGGVYEGSEGV